MTKWFLIEGFKCKGAKQRKKIIMSAKTQFTHQLVNQSFNQLKKSYKFLILIPIHPLKQFCEWSFNNEFGAQKKVSINVVAFSYFAGLKNEWSAENETSSRGSCRRSAEIMNLRHPSLLLLLGWVLYLLLL